MESFESPLPNLGAQPALSIHRAFSSSSMTPLTPFVKVLPLESLAGVAAAIAPAVVGVGKS